MIFFFFKQKTAYEMRISDWSSDVCSSDLWDEGLAAAYRDQAVSPADQQKIAILRGRADVDRIENERDYEINLRRVGQTDKRLSAPPSTRRAKISSGNADLSYLLGN